MPSQPHTIGGPGHFIARHSCNLSGFPLDLLKGDTPNDPMLSIRCDFDDQVTVAILSVFIAMNYLTH